MTLNIRTNPPPPPPKKKKRKKQSYDCGGVRLTMYNVTYITYRRIAMRSCFTCLCNL